MRALLLITLIACRPIPEPRGPRVVCSGSVVPAGYAVVGASECEQIPAERCWNDFSPECEEEREQRREHNRTTTRNNITILAVLCLVAAAAIIPLAVL